MVYITTEDMRFPLPDIGLTPGIEIVVPPTADGDTGNTGCNCGNDGSTGGDTGNAGTPGDTGSQLPTDSINPALLALAMGFVPVQAWEEPYDNDLALARGTIFPSLDKPFLGEEAVPR